MYAQDTCMDWSKRLSYEVLPEGDRVDVFVFAPVFESTEKLNCWRFGDGL